MATILAEYDRRYDSGLIRPDAAQRAVAARLDQLASELTAQAPNTGLLARFRKPPAPPKGLYIHGEVYEHGSVALKETQGITNAVYRILRNAGVLRPRVRPDIVVCWGGHSISREEYDYTKKVGYELGLRGPSSKTWSTGTKTCDKSTSTSRSRNCNS